MDSPPKRLSFFKKVRINIKSLIKIKKSPGTTSVAAHTGYHPTVLDMGSDYNCSSSDFHNGRYYNLATGLPYANSDFT
jgi:hypothetical protein